MGRAGAGTWGRSGNSYHTHLLLNNTTFTRSTPNFDTSHFCTDRKSTKNTLCSKINFKSKKSTYPKPNHIKLLNSSEKAFKNGNRFIFGLDLHTKFWIFNFFHCSKFQKLVFSQGCKQSNHLLNSLRIFFFPSMWFEASENWRHYACFSACPNL